MEDYFLGLNPGLYQQLAALSIIFLSALFISFAAWRNDFFKLSDEETVSFQMAFGRVLQAFALFLIIELFLIPNLFQFWDFDLSDDQVIKRGWQNITAAAFVAAGIFYLISTLSQKEIAIVIGQKGYRSALQKKILNYFQGALSWIVIYPWIIFLGQLIAILLSFIQLGPPIDQVAVQHIKQILQYPWLFMVTAISVVSLIPVVEELLFRGFLQGWLKGLYGNFLAIGITSVIFSLFHFSTSQGIDNIEVLASLFLLSCFLGFLKERFNSIWGSVGLHSTFNLVSILMLWESGK